ncbi:hypothetical protein PF010_g3666 [Phytophthora fragariae]|uniref:Protein kinase domain-containing protein n=1 Tax=Phytophthora fragariae TaxID=53985 RepID=A0A6G0LUM3_9STRA|nr:hypothetical protein PF010_g3666 [Phytophthora fragariae]
MRTTALMIAAQYGNTDVVQYLVTQCRANANAANADGYTAIRVAAERGHDVIQRFLTRFLIVHQADPETVTVCPAPSDATVNKASSWFIPPSEISLVSFVETGNVGGEYKAKWLDADAAVKLFVSDASSHVAFEHEVHFWHRLRHPNVIKMYGACDASPLPLQFFVCEYASNGSLLEYIKITPPEEQRVWTFLHQAALGLEYLHEREIIHGDLRCSNILIGSDGLAKLANFSRSNSMHRIRHDTTFAQVGSVRWQPPEVLKREASSFASDVYSLGMCILEAVNKEVPWNHIGTDYAVRDFLIKSESGAAFGVSCTSSSYSSLIQPAATTANLRKREETMAVFRHEVDIWFGLSHPHVVRLFGACHVGRPFFVCEFATNGTLVSYLRKHPDELWAKLHEAALGVQYLHARNVVHGDLKGNNIVIGSDKKAKVTDFGLSAITNDGVDPRISGASHWVAPECFIHEFARPTFESDIYALGMCIVEALRVVAAGEGNTKPRLPWGALDNFVAKCLVTERQLPPRPPLCTDDQWELVQRMCVFEPTKRLKISTVVDELAKMANMQNNSSTETSLTDPTDPARVLEVITTTQKWLAGRQGDNQRDSRSAVLSLYVSLWDHLKQVYHQIDNTLNFAGLEAFCLLVGEADRTTKNLKATPNSLVALTETTQRCYALQRRLEKFAEAHF